MAAEEGLSREMEVEAYRRLFPLLYFEQHLEKSVRPDARAPADARDTSVVLGPVTSAHGSALVKIGQTTMLAAIKMEIMTPPQESLDEGRIAVEFTMPPICSSAVRPAEVAPIISKQISDAIASCQMVNLKELSLVNGKSSWMAYLDVYCLNADGSLFDAALLSAVAAFTHLEFPLVSVNDDGRIDIVGGDAEVNDNVELMNQSRRKLTLNTIPFSLTCLIHKNHILIDPTAEEESIIETSLTIVFTSSGYLLAISKAGGLLTSAEVVKDCILLTKHRARLLKSILDDSSVATMDVD